MKNLLLLLLLVLSGCASMGKEVSQVQMMEFKKGVTMEKDVIAALGNPTSRSITATGEHTLGYVFSHAQARPETFIPIIGPLIGGADVRSSMVFFIFGSDGKLVDYSATHTELGTGAGSYQEPYRDQPSEAPK